MKTFTQAIAELDPKTVAARKRAIKRVSRTNSHCYPTLNEHGRPDSTYVNEDGEFSGKELTDWYVKTFCEMNRLKSV